MSYDRPVIGGVVARRRAVAHVHPRVSCLNPNPSRKSDPPIRVPPFA